MSDREALIRICEHLGLTRADRHRPAADTRPDEYAVVEGERAIVLGEGGGFPGLYVVFSFDAAGRAVGHEVYS